MESSPHPAAALCWMLTELLTELPKPSGTCVRLLPERRGQLLTLQAANLCYPQTCSSMLMMVVLLLLSPLADQCGAQQSSWLPLLLPALLL